MSGKVELRGKKDRTTKGTHRVILGWQESSAQNWGGGDIFYAFVKTHKAFHHKKWTSMYADFFLSQPGDGEILGWNTDWDRRIELFHKRVGGRWGKK